MYIIVNVSFHSQQKTRENILKVSKTFASLKKEVLSIKHQA